MEVPPWDEKDSVPSDDVLKPYPGEHACRLEDPGQFERFARKNCYKKHDGKCIDFIFGYPKEGGGKLQAMRYPKETWTASAAKSHCSSHKGSFEAASGASLGIEEVRQLFLEFETKVAKIVSESLVEFFKTKEGQTFITQSMFTTDAESVEKYFKEHEEEILKALKLKQSTGADPTEKSKGQGPTDVKKSESASQVVLDEAFSKQGKESKPSSPSPSPVQYDISGVVRELKNLVKILTKKET